MPAQETPTRVLELPPPTFGLGTINQLVPSHNSTSDWIVDVRPTATHWVALAHDTLLRESPALDGLGATVHPAPCHTSIKVCSVEPTWVSPTATQ
jgi:hypothetical protein